MSKTLELLDAIKARDGIASNYRLAQVLEIPENRLNDFYKGKRVPDEYAAARIALALGQNPMHVLAEIRAESEKNEKKREFWRNFLSRAASFMLAGSLLVTLIVTCPAEAQAASGFTTGESPIIQIMRTKLSGSYSVISVPTSSSWTFYGPR